MQTGNVTGQFVNFVASLLARQAHGAFPDFRGFKIEMLALR